MIETFSNHFGNQRARKKDAGSWFISKVAGIGIMSLSPNIDVAGGCIENTVKKKLHSLEKSFSC